MIGSGIEGGWVFTAADEMLIRDADEVFFCVADPATSVWIKARRPDAYDLYVLYDDSKLRYLTYMQMTEAMLHYVRRGRRVVAIFYGPPDSSCCPPTARSSSRAARATGPSCGRR